jgi:hypothetical protein
MTNHRGMSSVYLPHPQRQHMSARPLKSVEAHGRHASNESRDKEWEEEQLRMAFKRGQAAEREKRTQMWVNPSREDKVLVQQEMQAFMERQLAERAEAKERERQEAHAGPKDTTLDPRKVFRPKSAPYAWDDHENDPELTQRMGGRMHMVKDEDSPSKKLSTRGGYFPAHMTHIKDVEQLGLSIAEENSRLAAHRAELRKQEIAREKEAESRAAAYVPGWVRGTLH